MKIRVTGYWAANDFFGKVLWRETVVFNGNVAHRTADAITPTNYLLTALAKATPPKSQSAIVQHIVRETGRRGNAQEDLSSTIV